MFPRMVLAIQSILGEPECPQGPGCVRVRRIRRRA